MNEQGRQSGGWPTLLGELRIDVVEQGVQACLQVGQANDDADANDGSDEAILDGGRAGLVFQKAEEDMLHDDTLPGLFALKFALRSAELAGWD